MIKSHKHDQLTASIAAGQADRADPSPDPWELAARSIVRPNALTFFAQLRAESR
jgi:hypothetical protein